MLQDIHTWLQANSSWLQVAAAVAQAFAAVAAIPVAFIAAYWSAGRNARQAFKLSEEREKKQLNEQVALLRLLLELEVEGNFDELRRFRNNFLMSVDDEGNYEGPREKPRQNTGVQRQPNTPQHFIALYLPDLSYRFWHSQQLSALLPVALTRPEIHRINRIYSDFDRLLKIRTIFGRTAGWGGEAALPHPGQDDFEGSRLSTSSDELKDLLGEFDTTLRDVLDIGNPLKDAVEDKGGGQYISSEATGDSRARLKP